MPARGCGVLWLLSLRICRLPWCWGRWFSLICCCWWWDCGGLRRRLLVREGLMPRAKNFLPQGTQGYTVETNFLPQRTLRVTDECFLPRRTLRDTEGISRRAFV